MLNKAIKIWIIVAVLAVGYTAIFNESSEKPNFVVDAKTDLFLSYRNNIYETAVCDANESEGSWTIFCHAKDAKSGGLYEVTEKLESQTTTYNIYAANGKAQTHAKDLGLPVKLKD